MRHAAAALAVAPDTVLANPGPIFEQWVGIELWKRLQYLGRGALTYHRTKGGAEVDFIVELGNRLLPIDVKWTEQPSLADVGSLRAFVKDHRRRVRKAYVVCRCPRRLELDDDITAVPWWEL